MPQSSLSRLLPPSISHTHISAYSGLGTVLEAERALSDAKEDFEPIKLNYQHKNILFLYHCLRPVIGD